MQEHKKRDRTPGKAFKSHLGGAEAGPRPLQSEGPAAPLGRKATKARKKGLLGTSCPLPAWSSFSVLEMVEPVSAARVAEGEALYLESRLSSISLMLLAESPSFLIRMMRSWRGLATQSPLSTWAKEPRQRRRARHRPVHDHTEDICAWQVPRPCPSSGNKTHLEFKDVHEDRVALGGFFIQACRRPDPVEVGPIGREMDRGHGAAYGEVIGGHWEKLAHLGQRKGAGGKGRRNSVLRAFIMTR